MKQYFRKKGGQVYVWLLALIIGISTVLPASLASAEGATDGLVLTETCGWLESVYAEWSPVNGASSYHVYVKEAQAGDNTYEQIDSELIRKYKDDDGSYYYRADAVGLKAGTYQLKVVPIIGGEEQTSATAESDQLSVMAYDRTGFAWVDGEANGAYNEDGTLKDQAVVLYITQDTKDTVSLSVVTSSKGTTQTATGLQNILDLYKKGYDTRPLDVRLLGKVTDLADMEDGDIVFSGKSDTTRLSCGITFEGIGEDATAYGWGIRIKNISDMEVRNIGVMLVDSGEGDNIGLQQGNDHIWVHNCDFFYGEAGGDSDQVKGDGALDCKLSTYITFSYNHFFDNGKCNLLGLKENTTEGYYITYHHNWYDHSDSRHPRVRYYSAHVYNNYYDGNSKYGVGACLGSSIFVENNYFRNCKYPMMTSMQGSDVISDWTTLTRDVTNLATFSKEDGGTIKSYHNYIEGAAGYVTYQENATEFDAYEVQSADETVPSTVTSYAGGNTYNNFDTSSIMYEYTADTPEQAKVNVETYAGRVNGGDFQWTFTDEDDTSSDLNAALKAALEAYESKMVSVQSANDETEVTTTAGATEDETTAAVTTTQGQETTTESVAEKTTAAQEQTTQASSGQAIVQNFTSDGLTSSFFTISGNLSTSKGTVTYNGTTYTQCLKMETATTIAFTTTESGKLTLVFGGSTSAEGKKVKLNGTKYTIGSDSIIEISLEAGEQLIQKGDSINLFYMSYLPASSVGATMTKAEETTTAKAEEETTAKAEEGTTVVANVQTTEASEDTLGAASVTTAENGSTVANATVAQNEATATSATTVADESTVEDESAGEDESVQTGDRNLVLVYVWILFLSLFTGVILFRGRHQITKRR